MRLLLAAPPFAGHLHPLLELGVGLRARGHEVVVATGATKAEAVVQAGLAVHPLLPHDPGVFDRIADIGRRVGSNPVLLTRQLRANLTLLPRARMELDQLLAQWRPDAVLADFTAPVAGYAAQAAGVPWLTVMPSPCVLETSAGTPAYCGGWASPRSALGRLRDAAGRATVRATKRGMETVLGADFARAGVRVYRDDGSEAAYSDESILGIGMNEVELPRAWPGHFRMIGPLTRTPFEVPAPPPAQRPRILVTIGTHLAWAKRDLVGQVRALASRIPGYEFLVGLGDPGKGIVFREPGLTVVGYVDYDAVLSECSAVVHHAGTGVGYSAIRAGVPALSVPRDFDQFDYAVRFAGAGAALTTRASLGSARAAAKLRAVLEMDRTRLRALAAAAAKYDPITAAEEEMGRLFGC